MITTLFVLLIIAIAMYLVYRYVPDPLRWIFIAVLGIALIIVVFRVAGISLPKGSP